MANVHNVNVDRIKLRAKTFGVTLEFLNQCIGKYRGFLSCVRNGTDRIDEEELSLIADKINTTVAYLTGQTDDPEPPSIEAPENLSPLKRELIERVKSMTEDELRRMLDIADYVSKLNT